MRCLLVGLALLALAGCKSEPYKIVPVSGQVFLNGKPLPKAHVHFQPMGSTENPEPGPESYARSDQEGKFTLRVVALNRPGAVVGKHRIRIWLRDPVKEQPDAGGRLPKDPIPAIFNMESDVTFDVPPEGTTQADIKLVLPPE